MGSVYETHVALKEVLRRHPDTECNPDAGSSVSLSPSIARRDPQAPFRGPVHKLGKFSQIRYIEFIQRSESSVYRYFLVQDYLQVGIEGPVRPVDGSPAKKQALSIERC